MAFCSKCGNEIANGGTVCPICNPAPVYQTAPPVQQQPPYAPPQQQPYYPPYQPDPVATGDHTAEFDAKDISENKVLAMVPYILGSIGLIVALLAMHESRYVAFHVKQALKLTVATALTGIVTAILCWTFIVPFAGIIFLGILSVLKIIAFFQVCSGKAKEPAIIKNLPFFK